ncbi:aa3-type cytochrome oxidase subunit II [Microlunatus soli]|uniref:Cytochrome c oxidase subunit 2 n=1 Tax=Microlunatus soli TaxID=630515 RepID=A0A1H1PRQ8_9ACTN|nr:cytochrome c oxidase subunit 2 [Microlunatus soli]
MAPVSRPRVPLTKRSVPRTVSRLLLVSLGVGALSLAGCSAEQTAQLGRLGLPVAASDRTPYTHNLWIGSWIAAFGVGVLVWGMIVWCVVRYRRRKPGVPRQNRYNLPIEILYTVTPFIMIGVLFYFTVITQDKVQAKVAKPDHVVTVVGQKWNWSFNYQEAGNPAVGKDVWESGTIEDPADLYLPVGESVRFDLKSVDVIHSFWVPAFYEKLDVLPGRNATIDLTPTKEGVFAGKCAELCGTYHSAMLFNVHIVSQDEYVAHLKSLAAKGQTGKLKSLEHPSAVPQRPEEAGTEETKQGEG